MKKGFTLIELLAVIVILAIIALIATPIVLSIIDEAKDSATLRSADFYLRAVENSMSIATLNDKGITDGEYKILNTGNICIEEVDNECKDELIIEANGEKPSSGTITIQNGRIEDITLNLNDKTIIKGENEKLVFQEESKEEPLCKLVSGNAKEIGSKYECDFGGGVRKFYILELGNNPVSNSTLKSDEVALILEGNYDTTTHAWCDPAGANPTNNTCNANGLIGKLDEIASVWTKLEREQIGLPSIEQIMVADGRSENEMDTNPVTLTNSWLYNWPDNPSYALGETPPYTYWTSSLVGNTGCAWQVEYNGRLNDFNYLDDGNLDGVRPVITVLESDV